MSKEAIDEAIRKLGEDLEEGKPLSGKAFSKDDIEMLYAMGYHLFNAGDYKGANQVFHQLVISEPLEKKNWFSFASSLQMEKEYDRALIGWSMSALLDDADPMPHFHAAEALISLEKGDEATKALREAKERAGEDETLQNKIEELAKCAQQ